ncbi:DNA topoisomerase 2-binding protein 1-like [Paramacrobiotus metropolitanus]|uniref:DNA topoisomerase 2-binding protein 1-like n=1 Tax=Paramacrobiotus metropolitanus TaxID=2943436 RepID=UPI002445C0A2|nr:DNA topoisomerase 2-binding protein 1-like [Paramacrobiotus metropolitanus]
MDVIFVAEIPGTAQSAADAQIRKSFQDAFTSMNRPTEKNSPKSSRNRPGSVTKAPRSAALKDANARWVLPQDVGDMLHKYPEALFVCEKFQGSSFDQLVEGKCWMRGAESLSNLPSKLTFQEYLPVYSGIMDKMIVCLSGLPKSEEMQLHEMIRIMGGRVSRHLRSSCTHLVAAQAGTPKYFAAVEQRMAVVRPSWVRDLWQQMLEGDCAQRAKFVHIHQQKAALPYFQGLRIHIAAELATSMPASQLQACRDLVTDPAAGGLYIDAPTVGLTHVLCNRLPEDTENYPPGCHFLRLDWLLDSARERVCLNWKQYLLESPRSADTTMRTIAELERNITHLGEVEGEGVGGAQLLFSPDPKQRARAGVKRTYSDCALATSTPKKPVRTFSAAKFDLSPIKESDRNEKPQVPTGPSEPQLDQYPEPPATPSSLSKRVPHMFRRSSSESCVTSPQRSPRRSSTSHLARRILALQPDATRTTNSSGDTSAAADKTARDDPSQRPHHRLALPAGRGLAKKMLDECQRSEPRAPRVTWDDARPSVALARSASKSQVNGVGKASPVEIHKRDPSQFFFMFSRPANSEADSRLAQYLVQSIATLGAKQLKGSAYDPQVTHLLCSRPYLTEKFMVCCAVGKWVLHPQYIGDSLRAGYLLPEEDYEWGNAKAGRLMGSLSDTELRWATACHYWRLRVIRTGLHAFHGWRVNTQALTERRGSYERCLQSAGATILPADATVEEATHILHDFNDEGRSEAFELRYPGVGRKKEYLEEYLLQEAHPGYRHPPRLRRTQSARAANK